MKGQIRAEIITEKSALNSAFKRASSVGAMLLAAGGANGNARSWSRSAVRLNAPLHVNYNMLAPLTGSKEESYVRSGCATLNIED